MRITNLINNLKGVSYIDTLYKYLTFHDFLIAAFPFIQKVAIKKARRKQEKTILTCKKKKNITVVFFLQNPSIWKYDNIYWLFQKSKRYTPIVVASPYNVHLIYDKQECMLMLKKSMEFAKQKGYNCTCSYDFKNKHWLDIRGLYNPDIVFFTKPYKDTLPAYHIYNFKDKLTLYAPYGLTCINIFRTNYNLPFNNLLWIMTLETIFQKQYYDTYSLCKGSNGLVVGSFGTEQMIDPNYHSKDIWKPQGNNKKRIIWAPHHTVDYLFNFSTFIEYCDIMLEIAEEYKDIVQFAFKPHPVLKVKMINIWGKKKTEEYYAKWANGENTQLEEGHYTDLFLTSDAMIHDCASFTAEYLYTKKPVAFIVKNEKINEHWNTFGEQCFNAHYKVHNKEEIYDFIKLIVVGSDPMRAEREKIFDTILRPIDGMLPSNLLFNHIESILS